MPDVPSPASAAGRPGTRRREPVPHLETHLGSVTVVGASLAGLSAIEALRRVGFDGRIVAIGAEDRLPYDRPPLSKAVLEGGMPPEMTTLRRPAAIEALGVDWMLGRAAGGLDLDKRAVTLADGEPVSFDGLVIATGAEVRHLPGTPDLPGIHVLRTLDDCMALRAALDEGPRVAVVGAGFIGSEVAATCRKRGLDVDIVEALPVPFAPTLGATVGEWCAQLHRDEGVGVHLGVGVSSFVGTERVEGVRLSDGTLVEADVVVVGIGVTPATGWLEGSGLTLDNGVVCDDRCATGAPDVVAAGDVARWYNPAFDEEMRVEHWTNAVDQGAAAARRLVMGAGAAPAFAPVPYFWSDQYDVKIQFFGRARPDDEFRVVHGSPGSRDVVALVGRAGRLIGALSFNARGRAARYEPMIAARVGFEEALAGPS